MINDLSYHIFLHKKVSRLDNESMHIRAQLEKSEAIRQTLEFEVIKLQRNCERDQRSSTERETLLHDNNVKLKGMVTIAIMEICITIVNHSDLKI